MFLESFSGGLIATVRSVNSRVSARESALGSEREDLSPRRRQHRREDSKGARKYGGRNRNAADKNAASGPRECAVEKAKWKEDRRKGIKRKEIVTFKIKPTVP